MSTAFAMSASAPAASRGARPIPARRAPLACRAVAMAPPAGIPGGLAGSALAMRPRGGAARQLGAAGRPATGRAQKMGTVCFSGVAAAPAPSAGGTGGIIATIRAIAFYLTTIAISLPLFVIMLVQHPFVMMFDKYKRSAQHFVNDIWANLSTFLYYPIEVTGKENLPPRGQPVVYVANHASYLDIFSLFALWRPFKFISKTSNFMIPIIGWSMFLTGHVGLKRLDRRSQMECLQTCRNLLKEGVSVLFFPEGTRTDTGVMGEFKKGAFTIAAKEEVAVVPITLVGTYNLMPNGGEGRLNRGKVQIHIHPSITGGVKEADKMMDQARSVIASKLPPGSY